ncbi:MAG TPA: FtsX-like permease family protein, partial [Candidatus Polarisedimenticolaceae bacterium]|nr:FtsX-like permease family protein [Candidatus Polarisedimenticolaceae bacterium]
ATVYGLRLLPGDDASCLNLYRPQRPRLLGAPPELVRRGGFAPSGADDPWRKLDDELGPGVIPAIGDANSVQWILHLGLGQELPLEDERGQPLRLRIVGLFQGSLFQSELIVSERQFLAHFPSRSGYGYFLIDAPPAARATVAAALERGLERFGFDVTPAADKLAGYLAVENTYLSTFQVLGGLGLLLGTVGLAIVLLRNVLERRGELAMLRACGFPRRRLARMVLAENTFLLASGVALGSLAALATVAPRLATIAVPWASLAGMLALVLGTGTLASVLAVRSALRAALVPALREER